MACIQHEVTINARPEKVWEALRDVGALHTKLCPGFVTNTVMERPDLRVVSFGNGMSAREQIVDLCNDSHRLCWSIVGGRFTHHNGVAQLFAEGEGNTRFVWTADLLPNELAPGVGAMMQQGLQVMKKTLEHAAR